MTVTTVKQNGKFWHYTTADGLDVISLGNVGMFIDTSKPVTRKLIKVECSTSMLIIKPEYKISVFPDINAKRLMIVVADRDGSIMWIGHGVYKHISEVEDFQQTYFELTL